MEGMTMKANRPNYIRGMLRGWVVFAGLWWTITIPMTTWLWFVNSEGKPMDILFAVIYPVPYLLVGWFLIIVTRWVRAGFTSDASLIN